MRRSFFRPLALAIAAIGSVFMPTPKPVTIANGASSAVRTNREQTNQAPATVASAAANQSIGKIDAPDFRSHIEWRPIWVGRPRSRYGRQHGPYNRV